MIAVDKVCVVGRPATTLKDLPDTYPWGQVLKVACKDTDVARTVMKLRLPTGALFTGTPGNGRHTTAEALAGSLCAKTNRFCGYCRIFCGDLVTEEPRDLVPLLEYIEKKAQEGGLVLVVDQPELCAHSHLLQRGLLRCQQALARQDVELFLIFISDEAQSLIGELLSSFPLYPCVPPEQAIVRHWVSNIMKKPVPIKIADIGNVEIVDAVTGLSWRQLLDFHSHLLRLIVLRFSQNRKSFESKGVTEEIAYRDGLITLSREDVLPILESLRCPRPQDPIVLAQGIPQPAADVIQPIENVSTEEETLIGPTSAKVYSDEEIASLFNI